MATYSGQEHSYSNTANQKQMITDRIIMADPYDIAAITALGLDNTGKFSFVNQPGRTYTWLEDTYPAVSDTLNEAEMTDHSNTVTITCGDGDLYHVGDVVQIDSEYVWVSAISGNELTIVRGFGPSAQATHGTTSTAYIRYNARLEGAATSDSPWVEVGVQTNYSTIFQKEVEITRDDKLFPRYGISDLKAYRIDKNMDELMEQLNRMAYHGQTAAGAATTARSAGGLNIFVTTNANALSSAVLLRSHIDEELQDVYEGGGKTDLILCDAWFQQKINAFYEGFVSTQRSESIGGMLIKQLMHPITGQLVNVVVDRHCPSGYAYLLDTRHVGYITIDPFFYKDLASTGDYDLGETVGEYGFVCAANKFHAVISGYSTSS